MNRRQFLEFLGVAGVATAAVATGVAPIIAPEVSVYPKLYFTGMKWAQNSDTLAGQFLWRVQYDDLLGQPGETFWYQQIALPRYALQVSKYPTEYVRAMIQNGLHSVVDKMDMIVRDGEAGMAMTADCPLIPNPDYDPSKPESFEWDDEGDYNPKHLKDWDNPIKKQIKRYKIVSFPEDNGIGDAWNIDNVTRQILAGLKIEYKPHQA